MKIIGVVLLMMIVLLSCDKSNVSNSETIKENTKSYEIDLEGKDKKAGKCSIDDINIGKKDCDDPPAP